MRKLLSFFLVLSLTVILCSGSVFAGEASSEESLDTSEEVRLMNILKHYKNYMRSMM